MSMQAWRSGGREIGPRRSFHHVGALRCRSVTYSDSVCSMRPAKAIRAGRSIGGTDPMRTRFVPLWWPQERLRRFGVAARVRAGTSGMHANFIRANERRSRVSQENPTLPLRNVAQPLVVSRRFDLASSRSSRDARPDRPVRGKVN